MSNTPTNSDDMIDSRDVIARIEELESERDSRMDGDDGPGAVKQWDASEDGEELRTLKALADEAGGYAPDWEHGATLIRDSYFQTYAQELADELGAIPRDAAWPMTCVDWAEAASELQQDYSGVEFDGVTYWVR